MQRRDTPADDRSTVQKQYDDDTSPPERSPSAGWQETAAVMHATAGREECGVSGCDRDGDPVRVLDLGTAAVLREGVRCDHHAKEFVEVTS